MSVMGPFIYHGINPYVLSEYDWELRKATRIRSVIRVETESGIFALKRTNISMAQANRMSRVLKYLVASQFPIANLLTNKFGEEFIPVKKGLIYVTRWIPGKPIKLNFNPHLMLIVSQMAQLHKLGFSFAEAADNFPPSNVLQLKSSWSNKLEWLKDYQRTLKKKFSITTFESIYLSYLPDIIKWAEEALERLNQWVIQYDSSLAMRKTITHGKLHHRNTLISPEGKMCLLDFEHVALDTPIRDLAYFIRLYILNKEHQMWAKDWLSEYQKRVPLEIKEQKYLAINLFFPERLINLAQRYETVPKAGIDDDYLKKLQIRLGQMKELFWFVDQYSWLKN